ncbi:MAG TPA: hypothetical protein DER01_01095 [Phycisphaerales bacterium]|nr:hypothetical protein [Phycisphaerales bacterium]
MVFRLQSILQKYVVHGFKSVPKFCDWELSSTKKMIDNMFKRMNQKFGTRLVVLTMTVCSIAVILSCVCFIIFQLAQLRPNSQQTAKSIAQMTAIHSYAAVAFDDKQALHETLVSLRAIPDVQWVKITDAKGNVLDHYFNQPQSINHPESHKETFTEVQVTVPIIHDKMTIGHLQLHYDLKPQLLNLAYESLFILLIGLFAVSVAAMIGMRKHHELIKPIHALTTVAHTVRDSSNYTIRVKNDNTDDEVGTLIDVFNSMLDKTQHVYDELEQRVEERTGQLNEALEQAMAASQAKSLFLANMSHEIRTPMTAILGFSEILQDQNLPINERVKYLQTIERNGKHLLAIINDILDISKIEAQQLTVESIKTDLLDILHDVKSLMQAKALEKQLQFIVRIEAPFPQVILSDPIRIRQVLVNLLSNAVKFTSEGSITLTARLADPSDPMHSKLAFEVRDTGIGMSQSQVDKIFLPFTQADESTTRRFGGTGLGLTISLKLTHLLGGNLTASSVEGRGSVFSFTIANNAQESCKMIESSGTLGELLTEEFNKPDPADANQLSTSLAGLQVLLVEDGIDNQKLIGMLLKRAGIKVHIADNGQRALDKISEVHANDQRFDVILMDMQMPVMDGYTATRNLRQDGYTGPIIALTANAMNQDRDSCLKAGCDDYMAKPIKKQLLLEIIAKYTQRSQSANDQAA